MALRGNLRDFSLPDVFQLVTFSRKTGVLRIKREDEAMGSVWFRDGDVFFAQSNWHTEPLGERLVRAQRITPQALGKALELRAKEGEDGRRLGQILIDEGYITDKVLESFVQEQIQETIFDLMRWDDGEFDFEAMPEAVEEDIGLSVSIENIVMEGSRRLEEWNRIKKKIPSMDVVFKMATAPGEGTFEISLKPIEWNLLLLVDGTRSVAEMAADTSRTDFEVARIIYGLFSAGLLEFATDEEIEQLRAERAEREERLAEVTAARAASDEVARKAALDREAALEAEAEARASEAAAVEAASAAASAQDEAQALLEVAPVAPSEPVEMPGFLGGAVSAPTADDVAVLEEMMGAVLQQPVAAPQPEPEPQPEPAPEPYVPAEEPAFMSAPSAETFDMPLVPVPSVEDLLPEMAQLEAPPAESVEEAAEAVAEIATAALAEQEPVVPLAAEPVAEFGWEAPAVPQAEEPAVVEPQAPDELASLQAEIEAEPSDLLQPYVPLDASLLEVPMEPASEMYDERPLEATPDLEGVVEPAYDLGIPSELYANLEAEPAVEAAEPPATPDFERDLLALGLGELPSDLLKTAEPEPAAPSTFETPAETPEPLPQYEAAVEPMGLGGEGGFSELELLSASLDLPSEVPSAAPETDVQPDAVDFSELLESLDIAADEVPPVVLEPEMPAADFDEDLLREVAPEGETGGVISTDAFLEDISIDDLGYSFSGGLTDELSALTGADRPSRPTASVNKIPDEGAEGVLHRDTRVDKDTLLKIIDGIKGL